MKSCPSEPIYAPLRGLLGAQKSVLGYFHLAWLAVSRSPRTARGELLHGRPGYLDGARCHLQGFFHLARRCSLLGRHAPRGRKKMSVHDARGGSQDLETRVSHWKASMIRLSLLTGPHVYLELGRAGGLRAGFFLPSPDRFPDSVLAVFVPDITCGDR